MKMSKSEYDELIRKKPSLRPTELTGIKYASIPESDKGHLILPSNVKTTINFGPYEFEAPNGGKVTIVQEKPLKTPRTLKFTIFGDPVGKPRQTQSDRWKKRPCVMRYRAWADKARAAVPNGVSLGIYRQISFVAYLELPKSYSKAKRELLTGQPHMQKPDIDNAGKALLDALLPEDKYIWKFSGEKRWDDSFGPRIEVELR